MNQVAVLKAGTAYGAEHVNRLESLIQGATVTCWTDDWTNVSTATRLLPVDTYPDVTGWWWKLWLFSKLPPGTLYLDLDVTPVADLTPVFAHPGWAALHDPWQPTSFNTSVVMTGPKRPDLWTRFLEERPDKGRDKRYGDQKFFTKVLGPDVFAWPPNWFVSFKHHVKGIHNPVGARPVLPSTKVVYYHGRPKPWEPEGALS